MFKKTMATLLALVLTSGVFAGCTNDGSPGSSTGGNTGGTTNGTTNGASAGETVTLKVWGAQEDQTLLSEMVEDFKKANPNKTYNITFGVVGEPDARAKVLEDPAAAADVFSFSNDQINDLVGAGALYEVTRNKDKITNENMESSVEAAMVDGKLYAYPMTADNGYFLYYDKSVFSEDDVKSLDTMMKVANEKGKKVFMDVSNGWYIASFFLGAGGKLSIKDGKQLCDFNNENGVLAGEAIKKFTADPAFITGDDNVLKGEIGKSIAAGVSGTWNSKDMEDILGDNYAATKLPAFTMDGKEVQMGSFAGYKLVGINSQTQFPVDAADLAEWLTNEENQKKRFEEKKMGPSNKAVAESDVIKKEVALAALALQNKYATSQKDVLGAFWTPAEAFGTTMEAKDYSKSVKELLDAMVEQIQQ